MRACAAKKGGWAAGERAEADVPADRQLAAGVRWALKKLQKIPRTLVRSKRTNVKSIRFACPKSTWQILAFGVHHMT